MMPDDGFYVGPETSPHKYRLMECLGAGGEGEVWTADLVLSELGRRRVAVKILRDDQIGRDDKSWERHADLLRSVSHPGLVRVVEVFTGVRRHRLNDELPTGRDRYVVMDYIEGGTLRDWLTEHPESTLTVRLERLRNVAAALDEMHSGYLTVQPVAHGDVKPGNIVIRKDGTTVLVDFGLMRISDGTVVSGATTPYAAPELLRSGAPTTPEADRFAFAATVVHLILGEPPPTGRTGPDLDRTEAMLASSPLSARRHLLRTQVMAALRAQPEQRPENLSRWLSALTDSLSQVTEPGPEPVPGSKPAPDGVPGPPGRRPRRSRYLALTAAGVVLLTVLGLIAARGGQLPKHSARAGVLPGCAASGPAVSSASPPPVAASTTGDPDELSIFASQDKATLLDDFARDYGPRLAAGRCITIRVESRNSGKILTQLTQGWKPADGPRPDVWSPASSTWFELTRYKAQPGLLPTTAEPLFTTPLVIGMPKPMAQALGWPNADIGWAVLAALARDPAGWGRHGHPEWGPFRLGKTNPNYSASGFTATIGAYFAATGHSDELTKDDVDRPATQAFVKDIEKAVVHYGDTTLTFLANLRRADDRDTALSYISAVTVEEASLVAYNLGYPCGAASSEPGCAKKDPPKTPLVAIYPTEGTLYSDHPYVKMPGLSAAKDAVADDFLTYVHSNSQHVTDKLAEVGFRTFDGRPTTRLTSQNGAVPTITVRTLHRPPPPVLDEILKVWPALRKPANVLVVIDTSGSMNDKISDHGPTKLALVNQAAGDLVAPDGFGNADRVGLWQFSEGRNGGPDYRVVVPGAAMSTGQRALIETGIARMTAGGGTALFDTVNAAVGQIRSTWDPNAINAVVVLSDGKDEYSQTITTVEDLIPKIHSVDKPVRVFTIAYGRQAVIDEKSEAANKNSSDQDDKHGDLEIISDETGARRYTAQDPTTIADVLIDVISNF